MIKINLINAEKILFSNNNIRESFPEFKQIFQQWDLAKSHLVLRNIAKKAVSDLLSSLSNEQINRISFILKDDITIDNLEYNIVKNKTMSLDNINFEDFDLNFNFSISRDENELFLTFWR